MLLILRRAIARNSGSVSDAPHLDRGCLRENFIFHIPSSSGKDRLRKDGHAFLLLVFFGYRCSLMWHAHLARVFTGGTPVPLFQTAPVFVFNCCAIILPPPLEFHRRVS